MKKRFNPIFSKFNQPQSLVGVAVLAVFLLIHGGNLQNLLWVLVSLSTSGRHRESPSTLERIGDSGGDTTNPAGDPPPGDRNGAG